MRNSLFLAGGLTLLAWGPAVAQQSCDIPSGWRRAETSGLTVGYEATPAIATGRFFAIAFRICGAEIPSDRMPGLDATMPRHGHGMNYRPRIERVGPGAYRAEGLFLHMAGQWRLSFEVPGPDGVHRVSVDLDVPR